ncbi:MAG: energy-coupling factor transporter ATPase [Ruminococcaceae bacterium]|nr:energy-coupling factor transporter ATPase [Oscillospiraceae bacterium]
MEDNIIISAREVFFEYEDDPGSRALKNVSLDIERGSFVAILGHNGSGKSTFAKLINGILTPTSGRVLVNGLDTSEEKNLTEIRRKVGMVFQNPDNQIVGSVVEEDVAFGPENLGIEPSEIRKRVDEALETVGMAKYKLHAPGRLSGGQKQRVAVAGILAMMPQCIVLDESTAMLDPAGREEIISTVLKLNKERGITVVLITHYMNEAARADRVVVMNDGKVLCDGTPREVFSRVELLESVGLDVPGPTKLLYMLKKDPRFFSLPDGIVDEDEAAALVSDILNGRKKP